MGCQDVTARERPPLGASSMSWVRVQGWWPLGGRKRSGFLLEATPISCCKGPVSPCLAGEVRVGQRVPGSPAAASWLPRLLAWTAGVSRAEKIEPAETGGPGRSAGAPAAAALTPWKLTNILWGVHAPLGWLVSDAPPISRPVCLDPPTFSPFPCPSRVQEILSVKRRQEPVGPEWPGHGPGSARDPESRCGLGLTSLWCLSPE